MSSARTDRPRTAPTRPAGPRSQGPTGARSQGSTGARSQGSTGARAQGSTGSFAEVRMAVSHGLGVVALGLVVCVGLVVVGWAGDGSSGTSWPHAVRVGGQLWLLAHLGDLAVLSEVVTSTSPVDPPTTVPGELSLAPLGVSLLAGALLWRTGTRLARRCAPVRALALAVVVAAVLAVAAAGAALVTGTADVTPDPVACAVGAGLLAAAAGVAGVLQVHAGALTDRLPRQVAVQLRRVVPAAGVAVTAWLLGGAALLAAGLLVDLPTVASVHGALAPGALGGVLLLLGQVAYLPTAVVWAGGVLAGPGARLGDGQVTLSGSAVVDVPAVPLLAALPDPGPFPLWAYLGPLLVVGAGVLAGWHAHRDPSSRGATLLDRLADAVAVAALTGIASLALVALARGSLGPWQPLGPDLLLVPAAVTVQVLVGALAAGGALHLLAGRPLGRPGTSAPRWLRGADRPGTGGGAGSSRPTGGTVAPARWWDRARSGASGR